MLLRNGTTSVTAFADGCSPFGCHDMCGNGRKVNEVMAARGSVSFGAALSIKPRDQRGMQMVGHSLATLRRSLF